MPGSTDNANLLAAANQIIVALNEISGKLTGADSEALNRIGDAIEAQTTMQEARSVAETEALNTNFGNLVQAVDGISITVDTTSLVNAISACCANLQTQLGNIRIAIQNIRLQPSVTIGGGGGGFPNGDTGGQYSDDPPADNPQPQENLYVCKAANYIYSWMDTVLWVFGGAYTVKLITEQQVVTWVTGFVSGAISVPVVGPGAAAVVIIIATLCEILIQDKNAHILAYFEVLRSKFYEHKQEIICQLYTAGVANNPAAAREVYNTWTADLMDEVQAQEVAGFPYPLSDLYKATIGYMLTQVISNLSGYFLCNLLFDVNPDVEAAEIEDPLECDVCGCVVRWDFIEGVEDWEPTEAPNGNSVTQLWSTNEALRTEIYINYPNTGASGYWSYYPGQHGKTWVVSTGDTLETRLNCTGHPNNGASIYLQFTDETLLVITPDVVAGGTTFTLTVTEEYDGKEIQQIGIAYILGSASPSGTASDAEWDYVILTLSGGGC